MDKIARLHIRQERRVLWPVSYSRDFLRSFRSLQCKRRRFRLVQWSITLNLRGLHRSPWGNSQWRNCGIKTLDDIHKSSWKWSNNWNGIRTATRNVEWALSQTRATTWTSALSCNHSGKDWVIPTLFWCSRKRIDQVEVTPKYRRRFTNSHRSYPFRFHRSCLCN